VPEDGPERAKKAAGGRAGQCRPKQERETAKWSNKKKKKRQSVGEMSRTRRLLNASRTNLPRRVRGAINIRRIRGRSVVYLVSGSSLKIVSDCDTIDEKANFTAIAIESDTRNNIILLLSSVDIIDFIDSALHVEKNKSIFERYIILIFQCNFI